MNEEVDLFKKTINCRIQNEAVFSYFHTLSLCKNNKEEENWINFICDKERLLFKLNFLEENPDVL